MMASPYLKVAQAGRNKWWYYGLSLIVFPAIALCVVSIVVGILLGIGVLLYSALWNHEALPVFTSRDAERFIYSAPAWLFYSLATMVFSIWCLVMMAAIEKLHQRRILTVISADQSFRFQRFWAAFGLWLLFLALSLAIDYFIPPQRYQFALEPMEWLISLPFALLFAVVLALINELVRGYLLQGLGLLIRQPIALISLSALVAAVIRFTPEQPLLLLPLFGLGVGLATFTLKDNRLEIALGIQAATAFSIVLVHPPGVNGPNVPTLLIDHSSMVSPGLRLVRLLIGLGLIYVVFFRRKTDPLAKSAGE
jgi:uncharacterized protein